jgi:hypothetical protein
MPDRDLTTVRPWQKDPAQATVRHACPEHSIADVPADCWCCGGHGSVTDARLAEWQRRMMSGVHLL